ncbi:MAG: GTPase Era [Clostridia bacterium]|nr:GTPase Era [Clostridia bacterium]
MNDSFKSGYVGIVGRPNVGKSTLLNKLIGQKIAIISPKPQTTRGKILAIMTDEDSQVVFLDTPGFHKPKTKLGENMIKAVSETIADVDVLIMVVEPVAFTTNNELEIIEKIGDIPCILVINKADTVRRDELLPVIEHYNNLHQFADIVPISAKTGLSINELKKVIKSHLYEGPMFYPEDMITDQQEKQIVAEIIREKMLRMLDKEVPHGTAVEIIKMKYNGDNNKPTYSISANIYCEKASHKGIIIGAGGEMLKRIGTQARIECEKMLEAKVFLELWVKVKQDWRNSNNLMKELGLTE